MADFISWTPAVPFPEIALRLGLCAALGAIAGYDRTAHGRAAGLRTTMLVCLAACVASLLSESLFSQASTSAWRPDPARLAQGILAGMGFLGAAAVIRNGREVQGITTAATLWFLTVLGLTIGAGQYVLGLSAWFLGMIALMFFPALERLIHAEAFGCLTLTISAGGSTDEDIKHALAAAGMTIKSLGQEVDLPQTQRTLKLTLGYRRNNDALAFARRIETALAGLAGVIRYQWE